MARIYANETPLEGDSISFHYSAGSTRHHSLFLKVS